MLSQLTGAWHLRDWTIAYEDKRPQAKPYGDHPVGLIIYSADGWMSAAIGRAERARLPEGKSVRHLEDELLAAAYRGYFHYAGPFRLEGDQVIHCVALSLNPNFVGTEQVRQVEFKPNPDDKHHPLLVLSGQEAVKTGLRFHRLTWARDHLQCGV